MDNTDVQFGTLITGRDLERHFELQNALIEFARLFRDETNDRAMVIVGAAFLDTQLEHIVLNFLVDDEKEVAKLIQYDQPLGTYGGRISALYCLGLIGPVVRDDLRLVGKIRNRFAHNLHATFDDQAIQSWCNLLKWHRVAYMTPPAGASVRDLFNVGVNQLAAHLGGITSIARTSKRQIRNEFGDPNKK